jgi:hypothetical protein
MDASSTAVLTALSCPAPLFFGPLEAENIPTTSQTAPRPNPTATGIFPDVVTIIPVNVSNDGVTDADGSRSNASNVQVSFGDFTYYMLTV